MVITYYVETQFGQWWYTHVSVGVFVVNQLLWLFFLLNQSVSRDHIDCDRLCVWCKQLVSIALTWLNSKLTYLAHVLVIDNMNTDIYVLVQKTYPCVVKIEIVVKQNWNVYGKKRSIYMINKTIFVLFIYLEHKCDFRFTTVVNVYIYNI